MSWISNFFHAWERRLACRDDHERRVLPFDWGAEYLGANGNGRESSRLALAAAVERALADSDGFFGMDLSELGDGFELQGRTLLFPSPLTTGCEENDLTRASFFPRRPEKERGPAVVILPNWNAQEGAQDGLCRLLNRFGLTALKLVLPYHEKRMPLNLKRAEFTLSPNLGRTIQSCRQAVLDTRAAVGWLVEKGYGPIGVIGTSLGSCVAFIAFAHEPHLAAAVFNHISPFFADVVWRGISTRHVREGLEPHLDLGELRKLWMPISPSSFYRKLEERGRPSLLVYGLYDMSFPPDLSREVIREFRRRGIPHQVQALPCGHYTTGKFPFNWMDGLAICRFMSKQLVTAE